MSAELELELRSLHLGDHACLLYDSPADNWATVIPFVKQGLERRELCELVADDDERGALMQMLAEAGFDVDREQRRGAMVFAPSSHCGGFVEGRFTPRATIEIMEEGIRKCAASGFAGLRICGQVPYSRLVAKVDEQAWFEFEAMVNEFAPRKRVIVLCRHDMRRSAPSFTRDVLRVHPRAVIGPLVCPCAYYEPPRMALGQCSEEDRVRWMMDQLCRSRAAQLALEHAVQARDEFLSAASHELRTPLSSAQLNLQSVLRAAEHAGDDHVSAGWIAPRLRRAQEDMRRHVDVVHGLIEASQLREEEYLKLTVEPVDLVEIVRTAISGEEKHATQARCALLLEAPAAPIVGAWDRMRLQQLVTNVLANAIKFGAGNPVEISVWRIDATAHLVVRDHGIGIAEADLPRIFQRFERAAPTSHYGGFGLGLWIVKKIVEAFRGSATASSELGRGTTLTVQLPLER